MFMRMVYDEKLAQAAYILGCQRTGEAIVIDPERDVDRYIDLARANGLRITAVAETHIHADFVSGARELAEETGATVYVSAEGGADWRSEWLTQKSGGGEYPHRVLRDGDKFNIGGIELVAWHTPGHTPEHIAYIVTDRGSGADEPIGVVTGDFVFVGDLGRPDLLESAAGEAGAMEPAARRLHETVQRLDALPDFVQIWPGHGAGSACGKALGAVPTSTLGYERRFNRAIREAQDARGFVDFILAGQPEPPLYFATMKRVNKLGPRVLGRVPKPAQLAPGSLAAIDTADIAVIDTRPWAAFRDAHLPGSLSIPLDRAFNTDAGSLVAEHERIILILDPARIDEAVRDLIRVGLDHIEGWVDASAFESDASLTRGRIEDITPEQAAERIHAGDVRVLDVRRATEFAAGHIDGALQIAHTRLASRLHEVPDEKPWIVHCQSGVRSARAASLLQRRGRNVTNLRGGMLAWTRAGLPAITEPIASEANAS